jgi:hypothetical protein
MFSEKEQLWGCVYHKRKSHPWDKVWVTGWATEELWFDFWQRQNTFLFFEMSWMVLGPTQPPIQQVPGALSLELKPLENIANHPPPPSAKIKNQWRYNSILPLPSYMDNFINLFNLQCSINCWGYIASRYMNSANYAVEKVYGHSPF